MVEHEATPIRCRYLDMPTAPHRPVRSQRLRPARYFLARREALSITATSGSDCAAAAAMGGSHPVAASAMPTSVVGGGEPEVLLIVRKARRPRRDRLRDRAPVVPHQGHVRRLDRGIRAGGAHRDADVRLRERRRIVDAVADHRDDVPGPLQALDDADLLLRQATLPGPRARAAAATAAAATSCRSPVSSSTRRTPSARSAANASGTSGRSVSASAIRPTTWPPPPPAPRTRPRPRAPAHGADALRHLDAGASHEPLGATDARAPRRPIRQPHPRPGRPRTPSDSRTAEPAALGRPQDAAANGCSERRSSAAAGEQLRRSRPLTSSDHVGDLRPAHGDVSRSCPSRRCPPWPGLRDSGRP